MHIKIAVICEAIALVVLALMGVTKSFATYSNIRAHSAITRGLDHLETRKYGRAHEAFYDAVSARPDYLSGHQALLYSSLNDENADDSYIKDLAEGLLAQSEETGLAASAAHTANAVLRVRHAKQAKTPAERVKLLLAADQELKKAGAAHESQTDTYVSRGIIAYMIYKETNQPDYLKAAGSFLGAAARATDISASSLYPLSFTYGLLLFEQSRDRTALEQMRRSMELDPTEERGATNLALAYARRLFSKSISGEQKRVIIQETERLISQESPAYYMLKSAEAATYFELGEYETALNRFSGLVSSNKDRSSAVANVGFVSYASFKQSVNQSKPERPIANAVDALVEALTKKDLTPRGEAKINNMLGLCKEAGYPFTIKTHKNLETAEYYYREARRIDPTFWAPMRNLGASHQKKNEWKEALQYYSESIKARKQPDLDRAVKLFRTPPQIVEPPFVVGTLSVSPGNKGVTQESFPCLLIGVLPAYPGRVEEGKTKFAIDGVPQPHWSFVSDHNIVLVSKEQLKDGVHQLQAEFVDAGGNKRDFEWKFAVDEVDPVVESISPDPGGVVGPETVFTVKIAEDSSGVNLEKLRVTYMRPQSGTRKVDIIFAGAYQHDMKAIKAYRKQKIEDAQFKFTLPTAGILPGTIQLDVTLEDKSGRKGGGSYKFEYKK